MIMLRHITFMLPEILHIQNNKQLTKIVNGYDEIIFDVIKCMMVVNATVATW